MLPNTIYTKTAKGILEVKSKTIRLSRDLGLIFLAVDGKTPLPALLGKTGLRDEELQDGIDKLLANGYLAVFTPPAADDDNEEWNLDFSSPAKVAKLNQEAGERARTEALARARAEESARARSESVV